MLGHCAGLRNTQKLGDYVLAHGYVREDHVLDEELPLWVPIPALSEIQLALERAVAEVTQVKGAELKTITDHIAVLRPHAWMMLGHCAGLRPSQQLGDYVLAWAESAFAGRRAPVEEGGDWDAEFQVQDEPGPRRCLTLTLSGTEAFCQALRERFLGDSDY